MKSFVNEKWAVCISMSTFIALDLTQLWRHSDTILCRNHENRYLSNQDGHWVTPIRWNNLDASKTRWKENILRKLKFCGTLKSALISINIEKGTSEIKDKCFPYISQCMHTDRHRAIKHKKWIITDHPSVSQCLWRDHILQGLPFPHSISNLEPLRRKLFQVRIISNRNTFCGILKVLNSTFSP